MGRLSTEQAMKSPHSRKLLDEAKSLKRRASNLVKFAHSTSGFNGCKPRETWNKKEGKCRSAADAIGGADMRALLQRGGVRRRREKWDPAATPEGWRIPAASPPAASYSPPAASPLGYSPPAASPPGYSPPAASPAKQPTSAARRVVAEAAEAAVRRAERLARSARKAAEKNARVAAVLARIESIARAPPTPRRRSRRLNRADEEAALEAKKRGASGPRQREPKKQFSPK